MTALPEEMWFGTIAGQWPVYCWESETHAMAWYSDAKPGERRTLWKAKITDPVEYEVVTPKRFLQQKATGVTS